MFRIFCVSTQSNCHDKMHRDLQKLAGVHTLGNLSPPASLLREPQLVSQGCAGRTLERAWKIKFLRRADSSSQWKMPGCKNRGRMTEFTAVIISE